MIGERPCAHRAARFGRESLQRPNRSLVVADRARELDRSSSRIDATRGITRREIEERLGARWIVGARGSIGGAQSRRPARTKTPQIAGESALVRGARGGEAPFGGETFSERELHERLLTDFFRPTMQIAIARADVKDRLRATTEEAIARGVFGAPTFFVGPEMFFGQDRLDFVAEALAVR